MAKAQPQHPLGELLDTEEKRDQRKRTAAAALEKVNTTTRGRDMSEALRTIKAEKIVDARGTSCPGPILAAKKGIPSASVGGIMEVQATDSGTTKDLPAWSKKMGHEYLGVVEEPGYMRLCVKKMK